MQQIFWGAGCKHDGDLYCPAELQNLAKRNWKQETGQVSVYWLSIGWKEVVSQTCFYLWPYIWSLVLQPEHESPFHILFPPLLNLKPFHWFYWAFWYVQVLPYLEHFVISNAAWSSLSFHTMRVEWNHLSPTRLRTSVSLDHLWYFPQIILMLSSCSKMCSSISFSAEASCQAVWKSVPFKIYQVSGKSCLKTAASPFMSEGVRNSCN